MYVINPEDYDQSKLFKCNKELYEKLVFVFMIPLFGKDKEGIYYFAKTKDLDLILEKAEKMIGGDKQVDRK